MIPSLWQGLVPSGMPLQNIVRQASPVREPGILDWGVIDDIPIPCVKRNGLTYVAVRMVEQKFLTKYPADYPDDLKKRGPLPSVHMNSAEAHLLNSICSAYPKYSTGKQPYTANKDLIVSFTDFVQFFMDVKRCFGTRGSQQNRSKSYTRNKNSVTGGWLQVNNTIIPYVMRQDQKLMPLPIVRFAAGLLVDINIDISTPTEEERLYLQSSCAKAGLMINFDNSTPLVDDKTLVRATTERVFLTELPCDNPLGHAKYQHEDGFSHSTHCSTQGYPPGSSNLQLDASVSANYPNLNSLLRFDPHSANSTALNQYRIASSCSRSPKLKKHPSGIKSTMVQLQDVFRPTNQVSALSPINGVRHQEVPALVDVPCVPIEPVVIAPLDDRDGPQHTSKQLTSLVSTSLVSNISENHSQQVLTTAVRTGIISQSLTSALLSNTPLTAQGNRQVIPQKLQSTTNIHSSSQTAVPAPISSGSLQPVQIDTAITPKTTTPESVSACFESSSNEPPVVSEPTAALDVDPPAKVLTTTESNTSCPTSTNKSSPGPSHKHQQHKIRPIQYNGKMISCLVRDGRSYVLVEALSRVYFSFLPLAEFIDGLENILKVPLEVLAAEEEQTFINFFGLPTQNLKCNKVILLQKVHEYMPRLLYMFKPPPTKKTDVRKGDSSDVTIIDGSSDEDTYSEADVETKDNSSNVKNLKRKRSTSKQSISLPKCSKSSGVSALTSPAATVTRRTSPVNEDTVICIDE